MEKNVEHGPAVFAGPPPGKPAYQFFRVHFNVDDVINRFLDFGQDGLEGLRLSNRPWKSVKDETRPAIGLSQPFVNNPNDHLVGHELTLVHEGFALLPQG